MKPFFDKCIEKKEPSHTWFIPEFAKSNVGSEWGIVDELTMCLCPFVLQKYSINVFLTFCTDQVMFCGENIRESKVHHYRSKVHHYRSKVHHYRSKVHHYRSSIGLIFIAWAMTLRVYSFWLSLKSIMALFCAGSYTRWIVLQFVNEIFAYVIIRFNKQLLDP
jgi:hypothetical protein